MVKRTDIQEQELLQRLSEGDTVAFDRLFLTYYHGLLRYAKSLMPYPSDAAEDIVCNIFGHLWEHRLRLNISTSIAAYLYTSVKNKILREINRDKLYERTTDRTEHIDIADSIHYEPDNILQYKQLDERIRDLINKLPQRTKMVFLMNRNDKLTYDEIAVLLDISIHSVKTHMYRALLFLKSSVYIK
ncbi:DNA-directed RNA polymerase sigma-70 factor [Sphingobacterium alkalisoli]|uniref:RNA polymerase sigma-70 factor n=1 Tax=Sphingobacterium alkalisoli TaxID=1874115 RepID=UPI00145C5222|nr:RNA polymerase sigma-70 factor [Sphingobacterium alkalisoli]GGH29093.1 DNA-directed RNA polymerase sigma-70 factor [Sphingobacterium alkalisoli]